MVPGSAHHERSQSAWSIADVGCLPPPIRNLAVSASGPMKRRRNRVAPTIARIGTPTPPTEAVARAGADEGSAEAERIGSPGDGIGVRVRPSRPIRRVVALPMVRGGVAIPRSLKYLFLWFALPIALRTHYGLRRTSQRTGPATSNRGRVVPSPQGEAIPPRDARSVGWGARTGPRVLTKHVDFAPPPRPHTHPREVARHADLRHPRLLFPCP